MNHDENNPELQTWIEPELEARVVAAVLGEASAFETAELERLASERPELRVFWQRMAAVHGLVGQALRPEQAPMRLTPDRREKILQAIGATSTRPPGADKNAPILLELAAARRKRRKQQLWSYGLAASLTFAALVMVALIPSGQLKYRMLAAQKEKKSEVQLLEMPAIQADEPELAPAAVTLDAAEPLKNAPARREEMAGKLATEARARAWVPRFGVPQGHAGGVGAAGFRTDLKDVASAPTVVTPQFLQEFGATSAGYTGSLAYNSPPAGAATTFGEEGQKKLDAETGEEIIVLSPFDVSAPAGGGYMASSTLAGTRLKSNVGAVSLPQSIQLSDSAAGRAAGGAARSRPSVPAAAFSRDDGFLTGRKAESAHPVADSKGANVSASAVAVDQQLSRQRAALAPPPAPAVDAPRGETSAAKEYVSTFSLHVSDVSFRLAQAALARGERPDPERIRPEEFYNAFDYGDPAPAAADKIACRIEQSAHPLLQQRNLVRIAMKVPAAGRMAGQPLHLTVLLDTSGSMEREDRVASVKRALDVLASLLGPRDRVSLIGFARQPRLLAENLPGDQAAKLSELAGATPFAGGTNIEEALRLAGEIARRHLDPTAQNRIVLITDGAANLGNADPVQLAAAVERLRQQHIAFDACGVGTDGLDDAVLEPLARKGDGRYYVIDQPEDADVRFARQLAGAFRPAAENVKVQVRFNPARVGSYRLIGFEQHRLREEDFRNDRVDAAELAADEAAVALYQVEVLPQGEGELGDVFVRFRDAATGNMVERSWTILHEPHAPAFDRATPAMQLAGTAALLAEKLRGGKTADLIDLAALAPSVNALRGHYANNARVQELVAMFEQARRMTIR